MTRSSSLFWGLVALSAYWPGLPLSAQVRLPVHMSKVAGHVVDPRVKRSSMAQVNLHQLPGSHCLEQLVRADFR